MSPNVVVDDFAPPLLPRVSQMHVFEMLLSVPTYDSLVVLNQS